MITSPHAYKCQRGTCRRAPRRCDPRPPRDEKRLARRDGAKEVDGAKEKSATARQRDDATARRRGGVWHACERNDGQSTNL